MLDFTIINPSTNLSAIGNPTKSNHKITKMLGNIRQPNLQNLKDIIESIKELEQLEKGDEL
jgi:hypothetical protein